MEVFSCKTKILTGSGAIWELSQLQIKRLLLVADPFFQKTDVPDKLKAAAKASETACFFDVTPDPSVELSAKGTALLRTFQPDTVIALGGGSAMDCAKAMVYFSECPCRLIAIPTTSGSGSEVTNFAILTHNGNKHPLVDDRLYPDVAILDSNLLSTLPKTLVADAGFDIVAHAVESFVAINAGAISDSLALSAFTTAITHLPASFAGNLQVRQSLHTASTMAGMAFSQAGLGLCHAISHALGGQFHVAHGKLNAILLPAIVEVNSAKASQKYAQLARLAGLGGSADTIALRNLKNALLQLRKQLQLPQTLAQVGIKTGQFQENALIDAILSDPCCATNPVRPDAALARTVLRQVTGLG